MKTQQCVLFVLFFSYNKTCCQDYTTDESCHRKVAELHHNWRRSKKFSYCCEELKQGRIQEGGEGGRGRRELPGCSPPNHPKAEIKKTHFVDTMISEGLRGLPFSRIQARKSADDWNTGISKNKLIKLEKQEDWTLWVSHGTSSYIYMYMNAVTESVILQLYLRYDFYNVIFNTNKNHIKPQSHPPTPPSQRKIPGAHLSWKELKSSRKVPDMFVQF